MVGHGLEHRFQLACESGLGDRLVDCAAQAGHPRVARRSVDLEGEMAAAHAGFAIGGAKEVGPSKPA